MIGIICEYNPFHNGHLYHINKIKEMYPNQPITLILAGNFLERGDVSIINKWDKTKIALEHGIDLIVELPFVFATQGADIYAHGAIQLLTNLKVDKLIFGSECGDINLLKTLAETQVNNKNYNTTVKKYLKQGNNYPTSMSLALKELTNQTIKEPNDILGVCYIKEILLQKSTIEPITIKRTNNYHNEKLETICSATAIRKAIKEKKDITKFIPPTTEKYIKNISIDNLFHLFRYKVLTTNISNIQTIDEAIIPRIYKNINETTMEEFINKIKTKRYTHNRIKRMIIHTITNFTKQEANQNKDIHYIRILGFNNEGKKHLNKIKKTCTIPIISNFSKLKDPMLDIEYRSTCIYSFLFENKKEIIKSEYQNKPIIKN